MRHLNWILRRSAPPVHAIPPQRRSTIEITDRCTGVAHRVTDDAFAEGKRAGGSYVALCGAQVLPASLCAPGAQSLSSLRAGYLTMAWYLRTLGDRDTHFGTLHRGTVNAACGIRFQSRTVAFGRKELPDPPLDPDQVCLTCKSISRGKNTQPRDSAPTRRNGGARGV